MTKQEILQVLKPMFGEYKTALDKDFDYLVQKNLCSGFCFYLLQSGMEIRSFIEHTNPIINELVKDLQFKDETGEPWYITAIEISYQPKPYDLNKSIHPRIEHLKRTIIRLQNEINPDFPCLDYLHGEDRCTAQCNNCSDDIAEMWKCDNHPRE